MCNGAAGTETWCDGIGAPAELSAQPFVEIGHDFASWIASDLARALRPRESRGLYCPLPDPQFGGDVFDREAEVVMQDHHLALPLRQRTNGLSKIDQRSHIWLRPCLDPPSSDDRPTLGLRPTTSRPGTIAGDYNDPARQVVEHLAPRTAGPRSTQCLLNEVFPKLVRTAEQRHGTHHAHVVPTHDCLEAGGPSCAPNGHLPH